MTATVTEHRVDGLFVREVSGREDGTPPLVFVHGGFHGWWTWEHWQAYFAGLGRRTYALSLPGHRDSAPMPDAEFAALDLTDYAKAVRRVLDWLGEPVVLVGHSMGGIVAQLVARDCRVAGLALIASGRTREGEPFRADLPTGTPVTFGRAEARQNFFHEIDDAEFERIFALLSPESPAAMNDLARNGAVGVERFGCPVFVLTAGHDRPHVTELADEATRVYGATRVVVAEAGHDLMLDPTWREGAAHLRDWLVARSSSPAVLVGRFRDGDWDPEVRRRTELCLLDSLGCYSAGLSLPHFTPSAAVAERTLGRTAFATAYRYGQAANALDYDDTLFGHPGAPVVGAVLAVCARERLPLDRLLRGIAAGYETHAVLGAAAEPSPGRAAQVRTVGGWATVAASVGIGVALGFDDARLERVLGVAVAHSLPPYTAKWYERPVPALKNNLGWAAAGAVLATDLAIAGQTGVTHALDGDAGMWRMTGSDRWDLEKALGEKPAVLRVGFKHFPVCWHLQEYLKTFAALETPADEIAEIVVTGEKAIEKFCDPVPAGTADIAFSLPAAFGLVLSGVEPGPRWDSPVDGSAALRHLVRYERADRRTIAIRTHRGTESGAEVGTSDSVDPAAWGLDEAGVVAKHERLTGPALRDAIATALRDPESVPEPFYRLASH